jgi:hypothetical protein
MRIDPRSGERLDLHNIIQIRLRLRNEDRCSGSCSPRFTPDVCEGKVVRKGRAPLEQMQPFLGPRQLRQPNGVSA